LPTASCGLCTPDQERLKRAFEGANGPLKEGATAIEFRILGPLEAVENGRPIALGGSKQRTLLALLLLHANEPVSRDRLIDELWDGAPPDTAATALQVHVSQLRKSLGRETIATRPPGYLVEVEPERLDSERFASLVEEARAQPPEAAATVFREALRLWRGPVLADLDDSVARAERGRLEEERATALEDRIDADLAVGRHAQLVPELEQIVREEPLREWRRAQLMLALYRSGRQAEALEVYRHGQRLLADELGLEPGDQLKRLQKAILAHDESLAAPVAPTARPIASARGVARGRGRLLAVVGGALLLAGSLAAGIVLATGGSAAIVVRANSVAALDAKTGKVVADVPIGGSPAAIAVGAGSVWVADADHSTITRIDAKTKEVLPIGGLGSQVSDVAFGFGSLWVAGGNDGTLARIDPRHNGIRQVDLGGASGVAPGPVFTVRAGQRAVWVTRGNEIVRVDPGENAATARRSVVRPHGIGIGLGSVWVGTEDERVLRIDARSTKLTAAQDVSTQTYFPLIDHGSLWLVAFGLGESTAHVWRLNPGTLTQEASIPFPKGFPYALAAGDAAIWTLDPDRGVIWRIDPSTNHATRLATVPHHPVAVAVADGIVWVGVQADPL
jgi:DNA-binding SARP family transcriptional activator